MDNETPMYKFLHTLENKLKLGLKGPTSKSITKAEAISMLKMYLVAENPSNDDRYRGRFRNSDDTINTDEVDNMANNIIDFMYHRLRKNILFLNKPVTRRTKSARLSTPTRSRSMRRRSTRRSKRRSKRRTV